MLPTAAEGLSDHLGARRIEDVIWHLDGGVQLNVRADGVINDPQRSIDALKRAGYTEPHPPVPN